MQASEFLKLFVLPLKSSTNNFMFPSVACSSYFGYFVQFSRCVWSFVETRSKHSVNQMLESNFKLYAQFSFRKLLVGPSGLEPPTSRLSVVRSSQLSYGPISGFLSLRKRDSKNCLVAGNIVPHQRNETKPAQSSFCLLFSHFTPHGGEKG